jgi:hypothetical protein
MAPTEITNYPAFIYLLSQDKFPKSPSAVSLKFHRSHICIGIIILRSRRCSNNSLRLSTPHHPILLILFLLPCLADRYCDLRPIISGHPDRNLRHDPSARLANISPPDRFPLILIPPLQSAYSPNFKSLTSFSFSFPSLQPQSPSDNFLTQFRSPDLPIPLFSIQPIHQSIKKFDHGRPS